VAAALMARMAAMAGRVLEWGAAATVMIPLPYCLAMEQTINVVKSSGR
jgi:hypothetical protein